MPFENNTAAPAPTRRSSRLRTAASEAPADEATAGASAESTPIASPLSRREARQRLAPADQGLTPADQGLTPADQGLTPVETLVVAAASVAVEGESSTSTDAFESSTASASSDASSLTDASSSTDAFESSTASASIDASASGASSSTDAFERASQAFRAVTVETPAAASAEESVEASESDRVADAEHVAPRRPKARKLIALGATVGVMSIAGLLAVSMTLPAEAVAAVSGGQAALSTSLVAAAGEAAASTGDGEQIQAFVTSAEAQGESLTRAEDFSTVSFAELASEQGIKYTNELFTNDPDAAIQWPFLVGVGMSSGFGQRWGRMHEGIDFVPGEGAPIQAIADGTVRIATEQGGGYGVTVYIDHVIDGQVITSHYSHMQYGSLRVTAGQTVKVGDIVGLTGNTGHSFGAHLHFEIIVNGTPIDPLPWLQKNAGRYSY